MRNELGGARTRGELVAISSRAIAVLDMKAVRTRGLALWVTESDSKLNAWSTLTMSRKHTLVKGVRNGDIVKVQWP